MERRLADTAAGGQELMICLTVGRFFCPDAACTKSHHSAGNPAIPAPMTDRQGIREPITGANALRLPRIHRDPAGRICREEAPRPTPSDRTRHTIRAWGSRGRRFKSGRPDADQSPVRFGGTGL
jgi:hypothetical protein